MPWTADDAERFTSQADTPEKRRMWARTANSALARCLEKGGDKKECEARAIRIANSVVAEHKRAMHAFDVEIKGFDNAERTIWGWANTATIDRNHPIPDFIEAEAWLQAVRGFLARPHMLLMHQAIKAGEVTHFKITRRGLWIKAKIELDVAWQLVKSGVLRGLSIGWLPLESVLQEMSGRVVRVVKRLFLGEISLVDHPMNPEALIEGMEGKAMISKEQVTIDRLTGEIVVTGLSLEQMNEFMSWLDMHLGAGAVAEMKAISPRALVFKSAAPDTRSEEQESADEKNIFRKFVDMVKNHNQEDHMNTSDLEARMKDIDGRMKSVEEKIAGLSETIVQEVTKAVTSLTQKSEAASSHADAAANVAASADTSADAQQAEAAIRQARRDKLVELYKEMGLSEEEAIRRADDVSGKQAQKTEKTDPLDELARVVQTMNEVYAKRLDAIEELLLATQSKKLHLRAGAAKSTDDVYAGLPGANVIRGRRNP